MTGHLTWPDAIAIFSMCLLTSSSIWGIILRDMNLNRIEGELIREQLSKKEDEK